MNANDLFDKAVKDAQALSLILPIVEEVTRNPTAAAALLIQFRAEVGLLKKEIKQLREERNAAHKE